MQTIGSVTCASNLGSAQKTHCNQEVKAWNKTSIAIGAGVALMGATVTAMVCRYGISQDAILSGLNQDATALQGFAEETMGAIADSETYKFAATSLSNAGTTISANLNHVGSDLSRGFTEVGDVVSKGLSNTGTTISANLNHVGSEISKGFAEAGEAVSTGLSDAGMAISEKIDNSGVLAYAETVRGQVANGLSYVGESLSDTADKVQGFMFNVAFGKHGQNFLNNMASIAKEHKDDLNNTIRFVQDQAYGK